MYDRDNDINWLDHVMEQCNEAISAMKEQNREYSEAVHRRSALSMQVQGILDEASGAPFTVEKRDAIRDYLEFLLRDENMDEWVACYKKGFGDALRIVIETGALPNQR